MDNTFSKIIPQFSYEEILDSSFSFGKHGVIFSKQFDKVICLPSEANISNRVIKGHDDSIRLTFKILYRNFLPLFHKNIDIIKEKSPSQVCFVDRAEMIYSMFLASIGEVAFLDSTDGNFLSGLLFLPEDLTTLSFPQLKATHFFLDTIVQKAQKQNFVPLYEAMLVPSFETPLKECTYKSLSEIKNEIDTLYLTTYKSIS